MRHCFGFGAAPFVRMFSLRLLGSQGHAVTCQGIGERAQRLYGLQVTCGRLARESAGSVVGV